MSEQAPEADSDASGGQQQLSKRHLYRSPRAFDLSEQTIETDSQAPVGQPSEWQLRFAPWGPQQQYRKTRSDNKQSAECKSG